MTPSFVLSLTNSFIHFYIHHSICSFSNCIFHPNDFVSFFHCHPTLTIHPSIHSFSPQSTLSYIVLPVHLSTHSSIRPSICLPIHLSTHPSIHSLMQPFIHPSIHPTTHPPIHPFIHPYIHPSIHTSTHPSIHPSRLDLKRTGCFRDEQLFFHDTTCHVIRSKMNEKLCFEIIGAVL